MLLLNHFGSRCDPNVSGTPRSGYGELVKTRRFFPILASFPCNYSLILGRAAIRTFREPRGSNTGKSSKTIVLAYPGQFSMLLVTDFRSRCDPNVLGTPVSGHGEHVKTRRFVLFALVIYAISH